MKISHHLVAGSAGGCLLYLTVSKDIWLVTSFVVANSLIDIDHFLDYWVDHRKLLNVRGLIRACYTANYRHFIVPLHSFELTILLGIIYFMGLRSSLLAGVILGFALHLLMDQLHAGIRSPILFLLYRMKKKFIFDEIADIRKLEIKRKKINSDEKTVY